MEHENSPQDLTSNQDAGSDHLAGTSARSSTTTSGIRKRRGAKPGNCQAFKHGRYAKGHMAMMKDIAAHIRCTRALLKMGEKELAAREGRKPRKRIRIR